MKIPYIIAVPFILASSLLATPFDAGNSGSASTYVSIRDNNHIDIQTDGYYLTYREFLKYNTRYVKNKNKNGDRYVYEIENYGTTKDGVLLGSMKIIRSKDGKVMADYYFTSKNEFPDRGVSTYEVDETKGGLSITKTNIVNQELPHRKVICRSKNKADSVEWMVFYPSLIGRQLTKNDLWGAVGNSSMIVYCPQTGFIDMVGKDGNKSRTIPYKEQEKLRDAHPMNK